METQKEFEDRLKQIEAAITGYQSEAEKIKDNLVKFCPANFGDTVTVNDCSYSGQQMVIERIRYIGEMCWKGKDVKYRCTGPILKKDGTPGKNIGVFYV